MRPLRGLGAGLKGNPAASVCLGLIAVLAAYFALRSFMGAITETSALPTGDIYVFYYVDYFSYLDGHYSFWQLFERHNEHLILTTRLTLFVDTIWFGASGKFAIIVSYVLVLVTSLMLAYLAAAPNKWEMTGLAFVFVGLGCAAVQLDSLSLPFNVQFFFVHAFALAALIALRLGLEGRRRWYIMAFACGFGAMFSLGTGALLPFSYIAVAVWIRRIDGCFATLLAFHLLLILLYLWIGGAPGGVAFSSSIASRVEHFITFLGNFVAEWPEWVMLVGAVIAAACAGLFSWLTWRALSHGPRSSNEAVIAGFAAFVILEVIAASANRAHLGVGQALSSRYTTFSLLLVAALFAFVWRTARQPFSRVTALLVLGAVLVLANSRFYENSWLARNRAMDGIVAEINEGHASAGETADLGGVPLYMFRAVILRLRDLHLGPFRPSERITQIRSAVESRETPVPADH